MDYRDFLGAKEERCLPHLGGSRVAGPRPVRLERALPEGWYRFVLQGRKVLSSEPCEPDEALLESLPSVRGHLVGEHLALIDGSVRPVHLLPEWRPERFTPVLARRFGEGLLFHRPDFEEEAESLVREALDGGQGLDGVSGVPSSLRAAFALSLFEQVRETTGIAWQLQEVTPALASVARGGLAEAEEWLRRVDTLRRERLQQVDAGRAREAARPSSGRLRGRVLEERVDRALHEAGGVLLELRPLGEGLADVRWRLGDTRLLTLVRAETLQVVDSGVCLSGADERVTLQSLPGVILEAIRTGQLVITRRT